MNLKVLILTMGLAAAAAPGHAEVAYRLIPLFEADGLQGLEVEIRLAADDDGVTDLQLPNRFRGQTDLFKSLTAIDITGARDVIAPSPDTRRITSRPFALIVVRYRLQANLTSGQLPAHGAEARPAISPDSFHILGPGLFAYPKGREAEAARFTWQEPPGWGFATSLSRPGISVEDIVRSALLGGTGLSTSDYEGQDTALTVASDGDFGFDANLMNRKLIRVMDIANRFFGDGPPRYLVTLSTLEGGGSQVVSGTSLNGAFDLVTTQTYPADALAIHVSHEYIHNWLPAAVGGPEPGGAAGYWFSEGLSDYYGRKLALRSGIIDLSAYVSAWNEALNRHALSPYRDAPNAAIAEAFWQNEAAGHAAYDRGAILAAHWNRQWQARGVTLDQVVLALQAQAKADSHFAEKTFTERLSLVLRGLGIDIDASLRDHVTNGVPVDLDAGTFGGCLTVVHEQAPVLEPGYDPEQSGRTGIFTGVVPDSNAYKAGLRDGMKRVARLNGNPNDSTVPFAFRVTDADGQERTITYLPQGRKRYDRQRVTIPEGLDATQLVDCTVAVSADRNVPAASAR